MRYALGLVFATLLAAAGDPLETLRKEHPRLIALDSDIERLRGLIRANPQARKMYDSFVAEAAALESVPTVQYKIVGPRLLAQSRLCLDRVYRPRVDSRGAGEQGAAGGAGSLRERGVVGRGGAQLEPGL